MRPITALYIAAQLLLITTCSEPDRRSKKLIIKRPAKYIIAKRPKDTLSIAAVGDIMLGTSYPDSSTLPPDVSKSFAGASTYLKSADVAFGNLEGTLLDEGMPANYKMHLKSKAYLFRMPTHYGKVLYSAGFDVLSLANNHVSDFDLKGIKSTMCTLDSNQIFYGGLQLHPAALFKKGDVIYGFCAFSPNSNVLPLLDMQNAKKIIQNLKQKCDIVIVSFHGGAEGVQFEHLTKKPESYKGEKRGNVYAFAHMAIDAGADIVLGNGPHVNRAMEVYKNRVVAYSLGNFYTYKSVSTEGLCGLAPLLLININKKGEFLNGRVVSYTQNHTVGLVQDPRQRAFNRIKELTEADLPDSGLIFNADGRIGRANPYNN